MIHPIFLSDLFDMIPGNPSVAYSLIRNKPALLHEKSPIIEHEGETPLWHLINSLVKIPKICNYAENLQLAHKMIELDPTIDLNVIPKSQSLTILAGVLSLPDSQERRQLLHYLVLCGAKIPETLSDDQMLEIEKVRKSLAFTFSIGLEVLKMRQVAGNIFSFLPKETTWAIAVAAMTQSYPQFSKDFLIEKTSEILYGF